MTEDWKKYIQVNIYGRTLQELQKEGIVLESVLNKIGCSKLWIVEGSMYGGESVCSEGESESSHSDDDQEPLLSTTIATSGVPRFSTPRTSRHFTMNFTTNISHIHSDDDEINKISASSGTIQYEPSEVSTLHLNKTNSVVKNVLNELLDKVDENLKHREMKPYILTKSVSDPPVRKTTRKYKRRSSAPEMKLEPLADRSDNESPTATNPLKRGLSQPSCHKTKAAVDENRTLNSLLSDSDVSVDHFRTENVKQKVSPPRQVQCPIASVDWNHPVAYSFDRNDFSEDNISGEDEFFTMDEEPGSYDTTLDIGTFTPPPPNVLPTASILRQCGKSGNSKKTVSFRAPKKGTNVKKSEDNKLHVIKCEYPGCQREIAWKLKYGKLRLIDHALTHSTEKLLGCRSCDFACVTIRQMRYHYEKKHNKKKMEGFGMLELFSMPIEKMDVRTMWNSCYQGSLEVVGEVGTDSSKLRRKKEKNKKEKDAPGTSNEPDDEEEHEGSDFERPGNAYFYFRRIG